LRSRTLSPGSAHLETTKSRLLVIGFKMSPHIYQSGKSDTHGRWLEATNTC
jgi:hypothetical protein